MLRLLKKKKKRLDLNILPVVNKAAINMKIQPPLCHPTLISCGYIYTQSGVAESLVFLSEEFPGQKRLAGYGHRVQRVGHN